MSLIVLGWILIASSIVLAAFAIVSLARGVSGRRAVQAFRETSGVLMLPIAVFLCIAGVGAARSIVGERPDVAASANADKDMLARLDDYVRSIGPEARVSKVADGGSLPDVMTMIDRLAARLEKEPDDVNGWRMLGWSYANTGLYQQAASAYAKALELDPSSDEIAGAYEDAKAKASGGDKPDAVSLSPREVDGAQSADGLPRKTGVGPGETPAHETDAAVRSMVDRLADRLETSPRDVEGWTRLMRSRAVLGEAEAAATDFRRALDIFKDDSQASTAITATAVELGLKSDK